MDTALIRLTYCSRSVLPDNLRVESMHEILDVARRNNARNNVTGAIILADNCFGQILEGPADAVTETLERIQHDPRHRNLIILAAEKTETRNFSNWSMALAHEPHEGFAAAHAVFARAFAGEPNVAHDLQALIASWFLQHAV